MPLTPVHVALDAVLASVAGPVEAETLPLSACAGRVLAEPLRALRTQPPFPASAMDGYAVRAEDLVAGGSLTVIGEAAAGRAFDAALQPGQAVRIFTGAPVPDGADTILIQEKAEGVGSATIQPTGTEPPGRHIRAAGLDFREGEALLEPGRILDSAALGLAAAMGHPRLPVRRRPRIGILATGDELVLPGEPVGPGQIVASNSYSLAALVEAAGATAIDLGIARDEMADLAAKIALARAREVDLLITLGGASVGDHDLVQAALRAEGLDLGFWKIAMRPGKPMMHGTLGRLIVLGLPGNPVSSIVCGHLFVAPLIDALLGRPDPARDRSIAARLAKDMPANDERQDYLRATLRSEHDQIWVEPFARQDSSMLATLARADALLIRAPFAEPAKQGDACRIIRLR